MYRQPVGTLILALAVAMAPLGVRLPWWALGGCAVSWGYLLTGVHRGWDAPGRLVRWTAFVAGMAAVLISAGLRFDGGDFIGLLAVMAGIKPLEVQSRRDSMVTVFLAYFLVITSLFVFENLTMTLYLFVSVWVTTGVLIHVNDPKGEFGQQLWLAAKMILVALPLTVMLFLLFPRLSGSFLGAPWSRDSRSGFSSSMRMGDVSRLVLDGAPAFAVSFDSPVPDVQKRYWRGIVFERFDGVAWYPAINPPRRRGGIDGTERVRYSVILQPHGHRYLFALDLPLTADLAVATILDDHTVVARRGIHQRFHYEASSLLDFRNGAEDTPDAVYLELPANRNPRTMALANRWVQSDAGPDAIVAAGLSYFRDNDFRYTLRPDRLGVDAVDDFLFNARKGFCEHFASAFAVLMRAAGVPTRLVGGYQGGEWNELGEFLVVRQSDAHVWCEVWLAGQGWVRVDPTFEVAPDRIDSGIDGSLLGEGLPGFLGRHADDLLSRWIVNLRQTWQAVNIRWDLWFMGFSADDQWALFHRLVASVNSRSGWLLRLFLPALIIWVVILLARIRHKIGCRPHPDQALTIYNRFLSKMARTDLPKAPYQGPSDYAHAVSHRHPTLRRDILAITDRYIALRYGPTSTHEALKHFRLQVRRFNPRRGLKACGARSRERGMKKEGREMMDETTGPPNSTNPKNLD